MRKAVPILLWAAVLIAFGSLSYIKFQQSKRPSPSPSQSATIDPPGRLLENIPWRHFQDVPPFEMKNQLGEKFDSRTLAGKPYLVSFFFARCPVICRKLNKQIESLNEQLKDTKLQFISITVDPQNDSPEVLKRYAEDFGAQPQRWTFLTDQKYKIVQLGEQVFEVLVGENPEDHTHTEDMLLVDKWGRFRDRFRWNDPYDIRRLIQVVNEVAAEEAPPLEASFRTRNVVAGQAPVQLNRKLWIRDFHLTVSDNSKFNSRDLTGEVWIASFFYSTCKGTCPQQIAYLEKLHATQGDSLPKTVSITTDPEHDTVNVLSEYKKQVQGDERWIFCTGDPLLIRRISAEFFQALATDEHHSPLLYVVDRWHQVRGSFDWRKPEEEAKMLALIEKLKLEDRPVYDTSSSEKRIGFGEPELQEAGTTNEN